MRLLWKLAWLVPLAEKGRLCVGCCRISFFCRVGTQFGELDKLELLNPLENCNGNLSCAPARSDYDVVRPDRLEIFSCPDDGLAGRVEPLGLDPVFWSPVAPAG